MRNLLNIGAALAVILPIVCLFGTVEGMGTNKLEQRVDAGKTCIIGSGAVVVDTSASIITTSDSMTSVTASANAVNAASESTSASVTSASTLAGCGKTYVVQKGDTCDSVSKAATLSLSAFYALNTDIDKKCSNLKLDQPVCILAGTGAATDAATGTGTGTATATGTGAAIAATTDADSDPVTIVVYTTISSDFAVGTGGVSSGTATSSAGSSQPSKIDGCDKTYIVVKGDTCSTIAVAASLSLSDFYSANPTIDDKCSNLQLDQTVCIAESDVKGNSSSSLASSSESRADSTSEVQCSSASSSCVLSSSTDTSTQSSGGSSAVADVTSPVNTSPITSRTSAASMASSTSTVIVTAGSNSNDSVTSIVGSSARPRQLQTQSEIFFAVIFTSLVLY